MEPKYTGQPGGVNQPGQQPTPAPDQNQPGHLPDTSGKQRPLMISDFRPSAGAGTPQPHTTSSGPASALHSMPTPAADKPEATTPEPHHESFAKPAPPTIEPKEKTAHKSGLRDILSIAGVLVSALLLAFVLITFVFQSYQVDGPSMQTTLENNDHLIVWKVPKTTAKLTGQHYIPNRGDVIIFNEPIADGTTQNKQLIKRVIGLPGERVTVKDGVVTVYNKEFPEGFQPDKTLPYGNVITTTPGNVDVTVHENEVFVCGDNRTNSLDSRIFGPIESDQIVGKLVLRVLPLNTIKAF